MSITFQTATLFTYFLKKIKFLSKKNFYINRELYLSLYAMLCLFSIFYYIPRQSANRSEALLSQ